MPPRCPRQVDGAIALNTASMARDLWPDALKVMLCVLSSVEMMGRAHVGQYNTSERRG